MKIAVPKNWTTFQAELASPFPAKIEPSGKKEIRADLFQLAWGAYDAQGNLVKWGPLSGGKGWCPDTEMRCRTPVGQFSVQRKAGARCKSNKFPIGKGGAPMPYCMFFRGGFALHGSYTVPGYHASHGCVRIFPEDAKWLNQQFVEFPSAKNSYQRTGMTILPYSPRVQETTILKNR